MLDAHLDPERFQAVLDGLTRPNPREEALTRAVEHVASLQALRLPAPPADVRDRIARCVASLADVPTNGGTLRRLAAWLGMGPMPRPFVQRLAAASVVLGIVGGGGSTAAGLSPADLVVRIGEIGSAIISNLGPIDEQLAPVADNGTPTPTSPAPAASTPTATVEGATPQATATSTSSITTTPVSSSTSEPVGTATPVAPSVSITPAQGTPTLTASTPSATSPATQTPAATGTPEPDRVQTFEVSNAGSVTLRISGGLLSIVELSPAPGWTATIDQESPPEVDFESATERIRFSAELEDGVIKTSVEPR